jgi:hypothetical protein
VSAPSNAGSDGARAALPGLGPRGFGGGRIEKPQNAQQTLRRLLAYFEAFKLLLLLVGACVVLYTLLGLLGPYLMGVALDRFVARRDANGLGRIALYMLATFVLSNGFQVVANWLMAGISQRALQSLRGALFRHLQALPLSFFDRRSAGDLMSRLTNDIDAVNQAVAQNVTSLLASVLSMAGILVAMFVLDRWLALASLLVVPIMLWFTRFVAVYTRRGFKDLQQSLGDLNGVMQESISGQKVVKVFRRGDAVLAAFQAKNQQVYRAGVAANTYALLLMPLTAVLGNLFVIVLAGLGGYLALAGLVSVGVIATFINYGQNFINPLRQLSNLYNTIQAALAGAERVFQILDTPAEVDDAPPLANAPALAGAVRFERQRRRHDRARRADRRRQDHDRQSAHALLRARRRQHQHRRRRHPKFQESRASAQARPGATRHLLVCEQRDGEHSLRPARSLGRRGDAGGQRGGRRPLHSPAAAGLPNRALRARRQPQPGPAAAAGDRAHTAGQPGDLDPGRSHQQRRHPDRGAHSTFTFAPHARPHQLRDRASAQHHPRRDPSLGRERRPDYRARQSPAAVGAGRLLPPHVREPIQRPTALAADRAVLVEWPSTVASERTI